MFNQARCYTLLNQLRLYRVYYTSFPTFLYVSMPQTMPHSLYYSDTLYHFILNKIFLTVPTSSVIVQVYCTLNYIQYNWLVYCGYATISGYNVSTCYTNFYTLHYVLLPHSLKCGLVFFKYHFTLLVFVSEKQICKNYVILYTLGLQLVQLAPYRTFNSYRFLYPCLTQVSIF